MKDPHDPDYDPDAPNDQNGRTPIEIVIETLIATIAIAFLIVGLLTLAGQEW